MVCCARVMMEIGVAGCVASMMSATKIARPRTPNRWLRCGESSTGEITKGVT